MKQNISTFVNKIKNLTVNV